MTDKHDKLVEMARECGFSLVTNEGYQPTPAKLAAFRDRIVASLCADVEPVAWRSMEGSQYSLHHWAVDPYPESGPRIYRAAMAAARPPREPLYPASVVASLTAQRDAALARVAELEKALLDAGIDEYRAALAARSGT